VHAKKLRGICKIDLCELIDREKSMNITFRQIRLFLALAETGSVTAAARVMHVTQPTASMQLKEISHAVGLPLYEVVGKKIYLTQAGKELALTARDISMSWETFEQKMSDFKGLSRGKLRIAMVSTAKYFMPRIVGSFCKQYPQIDVTLEILNRDGVVGRLRENMDDLYIMSMPPVGMDLHDDVLMPNPIVVIDSESSDLAKRSHITLKDLRDRRFILRESGSGTRMAGDQFFKKKKFHPNIRLELGSNEAIKESVAGGLGLGLISKHALNSNPAQAGVHILELQGFPIPAAWHIVHHKNHKMTPAALAFRAHLMNEIHQRVNV
jgi:DNA-binding transcriptional LysR family regulator